jgi:phosphoglycolate phosphatase-like HAD superfamily hydrolase
VFSLEIVRRKFPKRSPVVAMIDFDGTVGLLRAGWHEVLISFHTEVLRATPAGREMDAVLLLQTIKKYIETNIGKPPIYQAYSLVNTINEFGGKPESPEEYNATYSERLTNLCEPRREALRQKKAEPQNFVVPGTFDLLEMLRINNVKIYMASGTEEHFIKEDVQLLQIEQYFNGGVYGSKPDPAAFSKAIMVEQILNENKITPDELLGIGDGITETAAVSEAGGFVIGVAADESGKMNVDSWKRYQLTHAGADWIIPNYTNIKLIESRLFAK